MASPKSSVELADIAAARARPLLGSIPRAMAMLCVSRTMTTITPRKVADSYTT